MLLTLSHRGALLEAWRFNFLLSAGLKMDVLKLTFDDESFDVVIDKGTLDSIVVRLIHKLVQTMSANLYS